MICKSLSGSWLSQVRCRHENCCHPPSLHPRAKLIVPTPISCSSGLAFKSAACIQRDVCHSSAHATEREKAERQSKATTKKKYPRQWHYFVCLPSPVMFQSCSSQGPVMKSFTGALLVFAFSWRVGWGRLISHGGVVFDRLNRLAKQIREEC